MVKILNAFRLTKRDDDYLNSLVEKRIFRNKTEAIDYFIDFYRLDRGIEIKLNRQINNWIKESYEKLWPFFFGCLFTFFFIRGTWFFLIPFGLALMPMIFKIDLVEPDKIKVRV